MLAIVAALPAFTVPPGLAHIGCPSTHALESIAGNPFVPREATYGATGFGRLPLDSVVECFVGSDPR
jgi:hypothetical protein